MKRRGLLMGGLGVVAAGIAGWVQRDSIFDWWATRSEHDIALSEAPLVADTHCVLTREQVEGPYHITSELRQDIREGLPGMNLSLDLQIVGADGCSPLAGAAVDIWHCDAAGVYSGFPPDLARSPTGTIALIAQSDGKPDPTNETRFLRGAQISDSDGLVHFETIIPGWYSLRAPHIHVKVILDETTALTTQLYFPDEFTHELYAGHDAYRAYGTSPYNLKNDSVIGEKSDGQGLLLLPQKNGDGVKSSGRLGIG